MPANSYLGQPAVNVQVNAGAAFSWAPTVTLAKLRNIPVTTGTVMSPPTSPPPSEGDFYEFADEDGTCGSTHPIVLKPLDTSTIRGAATFTITTPFASGRLTYSAEINQWILSLGASGNNAAPNKAQATVISGTQVAAAANIAQVAAFTSKTGKVRINFSCSYAIPGAGVVTPLLQHAPHAGGAAVVDYVWTQFGNLAESISVTIEVAVAAGTSFDFEALTTAGDHTITLGQGAASTGAVLIVEDVAA